MSISSKIQSLITAANSVTGESRTDLTACVQDLKDGYGGGGLPAEYEAVEYISASGGQMLVIPYSIKVADILLMKAKINFNAAWKVFFGVAYGNRVIYLQTYTSQNYLYYNLGGANSSFWFDGSLAHDFIIQGKNLLCDSSIKVSSGAESRDCEPKFGIFGTTTGEVTTNPQGSGDVYYVRIMGTDGTTEIDLIPCYRKSDNEIGMYDLVAGTFYTNAGTGSFTCYPAPPTT